MYMTIPNGSPVARLQSLLPNVINPTALSDDELTVRGIARCEIIRPALDWWQTYGEPITDTAVRPVTITYPVIGLPLEDVRALAWERIKSERETRQSGLMPFEFPNKVLNHVEMNERAKSDLTAQTTAAVGMLVAGIPGTLIWTTFENVTHTLVPQEMLALGFAGGQFVAGIHAASQQLRQQINDAETVADVVAVGWGD